MWEYDIRLYVGETTKNLINYQNQMGNDGWEAYQVFKEANNTGLDNYTVFYKRNIKRHG